MRLLIAILCCLMLCGCVSQTVIDAQANNPIPTPVFPSLSNEESPDSMYISSIPSETQNIGEEGFIPADASVMSKYSYALSPHTEDIYPADSNFCYYIENQNNEKTYGLRSRSYAIEEIRDIADSVQNNYYDDNSFDVISFLSNAGIEGIEQIQKLESYDTLHSIYITEVPSHNKICLILKYFRNYGFAVIFEGEPSGYSAKNAVMGWHLGSFSYNGNQWLIFFHYTNCLWLNAATNNIDLSYTGTYYENGPIAKQVSMGENFYASAPQLCDTGEDKYISLELYKRVYFNYYSEIEGGDTIAEAPSPDEAAFCCHIKLYYSNDRRAFYTKNEACRDYLVAPYSIDSIKYFVPSFINRLSEFEDEYHKRLMTEYIK